MMISVGFLFFGLFFKIVSAQVVVEYLFDNTTCSTQYYQASTFFSNVCIPANEIKNINTPSKFSPTVSQTPTTITSTSNFYGPSDVSCTGSIQGSTTLNLNKTCGYDSDGKYYHNYKYFASDPGVTALVGNNVKGYGVVR